MYVMEFNIIIGTFKVNSLISCEIIKSVDSLSDIAKLALPGMAYGKTLNVDNKIRRGDLITIELGYKGHLKKEFEGYVTSITNDNTIVIEAEDSMYLTRKEVKSKRYANVDATDVIKDIVDQLEGVGLVLGDGVDILKYDTFTVADATGLEVLKKIQEETNLHIFMKGATLHVYLQYTYKSGDVVFDFSQNVEKSNLTYVYEADKKVLVEVIGMTRENKKTIVKVGEAGGDKITIHRYNVSDEAALKVIGEEEIIKHRYSGYEGTIDTWLLPYCTYGFSARIIDNDFPNQEGIYYITSSAIRFSKEGGVRKLGLGLKVG